MVGEIITTIGGGVGLAWVAKYGFDALKVYLVTRNARPGDMPKIANAAFPRYELGPLRRRPVDQADDAAQDDAQQDDDEGLEDGDEQHDPPPHS